MYTILEIICYCYAISLGRSTYIYVIKCNQMCIWIMYFKYLAQGTITHDGHIEVNY